MKKIMFNDKYGLETSVLIGTKDMTRRVARYRGKQDVFYYRWPSRRVVDDGQYLFIECLDADGMSFEPEQYIRSHYHVGEIVAIAQSYKQVIKEWTKGYGKGFSFGLEDRAGMSNKMFVKPEYMPHHIRISRIFAQELQHISEEDALREGVIRVDENSRVLGCNPYYTYYGSKFHGETAKAAFISLIDKLRKKPKTNINGREIPCEPYNPIVFVYEFELVD